MTIRDQLIELIEASYQAETINIPSDLFRRICTLVTEEKRYLAHELELEKCVTRRLKLDNAELKHTLAQIQQIAEKNPFTSIGHVLEHSVKPFVKSRGNDA